MIAGQDHLYPKVELAGSSVDPQTGGIITITEPHALIHSGKMFHWAGKVTGLLNASAVDFLFKVPAATYPHIHRMRANVGAGDVDIQAFEGTTVSADGTPLVVDNLNRNSVITPDMTMFFNPTVTADGTEIHNIWIPPTSAGVGQSIQGVSGATAGEEWILKPSTNYLQRITNNSGSTISAWVEILFYELDGLVIDA